MRLPAVISYTYLSISTRYPVVYELARLFATFPYIFPFKQTQKEGRRRRLVEYIRKSQIYTMFVSNAHEFILYSLFTPSSYYWMNHFTHNKINHVNMQQTKIQKAQQRRLKDETQLHAFFFFPFSQKNLCVWCCGKLVVNITCGSVL